MPLLVGTEFSEFTNQMSCGELGHEDLARVNADGAMLAGVIDLDDPIAEVVAYASCEHV